MTDEFKGRNIDEYMDFQAETGDGTMKEHIARKDDINYWIN